MNRHTWYRRVAAGSKKALAPLSEAEILETAEAWRPWRGYAVINLWNSSARPDA